MKGMWSLLASGENRRHLLRRKSEVLFAFAFLVALIVFGAIASPYFLKIRNIRNIFTLIIGLVLMSYAQLYILIIGGVDLSVGSVVSVTNVICATMMTESVGNWLLTMLVCLAVSAVIGVINGLLVTKGNLQPLIATLATQTIFAGVALAVLSGPGGMIPKALTDFLTKGYDYKVPIVFILCFTVLAWLILNRTKLGRAMLAVGGGQQSAEAAGIDVDLVKIKAFVLSALFAGVAGIYISVYSTSGNPLLGSTYTQRSITSAVIGGALLTGGKGSILGCLIGALILGIITNLLNLLNINTYYQFVLQGVLLTLTLSVSAIRSRK